jgi:hypothetical protein
MCRRRQPGSRGGGSLNSAEASVGWVSVPGKRLSDASHIRAPAIAIYFPRVGNRLVGPDPSLATSTEPLPKRSAHLPFRRVAQALAMVREVRVGRGPTRSGFTPVLVRCRSGTCATVEATSVAAIVRVIAALQRFVAPGVAKH